jgi:hypothetical protein
MPRQFSLKTLLWLMVVVGAFFAGLILRPDSYEVHTILINGEKKTEYMRRADGSRWLRVND